MRNLLIISLFLPLIYLSSCVSQNEEEVFPNANKIKYPIPTGRPDTTITNMDTVITFKIAYNPEVKDFMQFHCTGCHDTGNDKSDVDFDTYAELKAAIDNGSILGVIKHESGWEPMPQSFPKLVNEEVKFLEDWIDNGLPEN